MDALVGADRNRPLDVGQLPVVTGRQRLLDQRNAGAGAGGQVLLQVGLGPGFVGVDDEFGTGRGLPHGGDPQAIAFAAELDLEERPVRGFRSRCRHRLRRAERDGIGGHGRTGGEAAEPIPNADADLLGFKIEQGAIQRIAGGRRRHSRLQGFPIQSAADRVPHCQNCRERRLRCLAITRIGNAFAAPGDTVAADFGHHHHRFGLGAAADGEVAFDRPMFDSRVKRWRFAGSHFSISLNIWPI